MPELDIESADAFLDAVTTLREEFKRGGRLSLSWKVEGGMTATQRASIHVLFEIIARDLNDAGLDMKRVLKQEVDIPWSKTTVKEFLYRPLLTAMTTKVSTEEQTTVEPDQVYKVLCRHLADKHGFSCPPFPSRFNHD